MLTERITPSPGVRIKSFAALPDWYDPITAESEYDHETDHRIMKMEKAIQRQPDHIREPLTAYLASNATLSEACRMLSDGKYNHSNTDRIKWALQIIKHTLLMGLDNRYAHEFKKQGIVGLTKRVAGILFSIMSNPNRRAETIAAYDRIVDAMLLLGYGHIMPRKFRVSHVQALLMELKRGDSLDKKAPVHMRRIRSLFDMLADLGVYKKNPFVDVKFKDGRIIEKRSRPKRNYTVDWHRPVKAIDSLGNTVGVYTRIVEATKDGYSQASIADVIGGFRKSHKGLLWVYAGEPSAAPAKKISDRDRFRKNDNWSNSGPVVRMDKDGSVIETFLSLKEAQKFGFDPDLIKKVIAGEHESHAKSLWAYSSPQPVMA